MSHPIDPGSHDVFVVYVEDEPVLALVEHYLPGVPASLGCHDRRGDLIDPGHPAESEEIEVSIYALDGARDPELERIADLEDVAHQALAAIHDLQRKAAKEAA